MKALQLPVTSSSIGEGLGPLSDEGLLERIQAHMLDALEILHLRYSPLLRVVAMNVLHNGADTDDLLQEVFLEIWKKAGDFDPLKGTPLAWLLTLARRRSIDRLRKRNTYLRFQDRLEEEGKYQFHGWTHVHEDAAQSEMHEYLRGALADLPDAQQVAIRFAYQQEMTQREIAAHTGVPLGTIKTRLELGLKKLAVSLMRFKEGRDHRCVATT